MATRSDGAMTKRIVPTQVLTILPSLASRLLAQLPFDRHPRRKPKLCRPCQPQAVAPRRARKPSGGSDRPGDSLRSGGLGDDRHFHPPSRHQAALPDRGAILPRRRALRIRVVAPSANSLRSRPSPCRLKPGAPAACRRRNAGAASCPPRRRSRARGRTGAHPRSPPRSHGR